MLGDMNNSDPKARILEFPGGLVVKNLLLLQEAWAGSLLRGSCLLLLKKEASIPRRLKV